MDRIVVAGIGLDVADHGAGEPVVVIHAGVCADWFKGLRNEPALAGSYRVIGYHRAGYASSDRVEGPFSIHQQAEQCRSLLRHLGITRAHVVGHSSGAAIALQLALDHPDAATFFGQELPAMREWSFDRSHAERITKPALLVLGARSGEVSPAFGQRHDLLLAWLPGAEPFVLPDATHLLHVQNPVGMAVGLVRFFASHPIDDPT